MSTVILDTHVVQWWSAEPSRLSRKAVASVEAADELAVCTVTWFELAWLANHQRIVVSIPVRSWLEQLSALVRTLPLTPAIAATAAALPDTFPGDPADRLIYATAVEHGWSLVTKDGRLRRHVHPRRVAIW
ncbi:MAG: type II toxin-antitoxin system VapC family toxin [Pseudonocardiales bacterium]|nr:MAG: type II toxin-antitoxin system VapC family toxin [Pseudonocardiales bacterium]